VVGSIVRFVTKPLGYLAFVLGLAALSASAYVLGDRHELGFFSGRLARTVWRYPEVTRRGVQTAWLVWTALFVVAISPVDPITSRWDEVALVALALGGVWHRLGGGHRAEH
jgi:hypothetical protein